MTITHDAKTKTFDPIAAHRYVLPIVREISRAAAAPRNNSAPPSKLQTEGRATDAAELERVVMAASAGDRTAVSELIQRFAGRVRRGARAHGLALHDVEDVIQTTWLRFLQHIDEIRNPNAVGAWLETTARHESLRVLKAASRERPTDNDVVFDAPAPPVDEEPPRMPERSAAVLSIALEQLTGRQRELLSILFADPAPCYAEVSRAIGMPIGSIGPTRTRGLARLRENQDLRDLAKEYLDDDAEPAAA